MENFPQLTGQKTRQVAAEKAGFGNETTYRQAKAVVEKAEPELVDASMMEFSPEYAPLSPVQEPKWRVKTLLMKLESDRKNKTDYVSSKFAAKTKEIFSGLPKPKDFITFASHDLPLLFTPAEVQEFALKHRLNKSQTKAVNEMSKAGNWRSCAVNLLHKPKRYFQACPSRRIGTPSRTTTSPSFSPPLKCRNSL